MERDRRRAGFVGALLHAGSAVVLVGCAAAAPPEDGTVPAGAITVRATDTTCEISTSRAQAGTLTFTVTNDGDAAAAFSLHDEDDRLVGEVENIGRGRTRLLTVDVPDGGVYTTECRPGTAGRAPFTVVVGTPVDLTAKLAEATAGYERYVRAQAASLVPRTQELVDAVKAGDVERARALFPTAHTSYERIEPVAESFRDLEPRLDGREDDGRDEGVAWTGFRRLEKDLWVDGLRPDSAQVADRLATDVGDLRSRVDGMRMNPAQLAETAAELIDEVAEGTVVGATDRYSHTDLWDLAANIEGCRAAVAALRPVIDEKDPTLGPVLDERFAAVDRLLEDYRAGDGFRSYAELTRNDVKAVTDAVDALAEPVSQVAGVVTS